MLPKGKNALKLLLTEVVGQIRYVQTHPCLSDKIKLFYSTFTKELLSSKKVCDGYQVVSLIVLANRPLNTNQMSSTLYDNWCNISVVDNYIQYNQMKP